MTSTKTRVNKISTVVIPVSDQDRAIEFYVEKLGFEKRTDLPFGDGDQILRSIHDKYFALPDETVVVPGHGPVTTLGREKQFNYFLQGM